MQNLRVIYILWWRQVLRFFRKKSRLIGTIVQPLIMLFAMSAGLSGVFEAAGQENYMGFLAAGIIAINTMMGSLSSGMDIIRDKELGFMKECLVSPAKRLYVMIGRTFGGATTGFLQGVLLLVILILFGRLDFPGIGAIFSSILFMMGVSILFSALGIIIASLIPDFQGFQLVNNFLIMPLMMLSGSMYPLDTAATWLQRVARFNPLAYGVDGLRWSLTDSSFLGMGQDVIVLGILMFVFIVLGGYTFSRMKLED